MTHPPSKTSHPQSGLRRPAVLGLLALLLALAVVFAGLKRSGSGPAALAQVAERDAGPSTSEGTLNNVSSRQDSIEGTTPPLVDVAPVTRTSRAPVAQLDPALAKVTVAVRQAGKPVEGAIVALRGTGDPVVAARTDVDAEGRALTNERGLASFGVRPMLTWHGRAALTDGSCERSFSFTSRRASETNRIEVSLREDERLERVTLLVRSLPGGWPLAGATVTVVPTGSSVVAALQADPTGVTGHDGSFEMLLSKSSELRVEAEGHTPRLLSPRKLGIDDPSSAPELARPPIEVPLATLGVLWGSFGPEWAGAQLTGINASSRRTATGGFPTNYLRTLDANGHWEIRDLPTGATEEESPMRLMLMVLGTRQESRHGSLGRDIRLEPGEVREIPNPWQRAAALEVTALGADGTPVPSGTTLALVYRSGEFPLKGQTLASGQVAEGGAWRSSVAVPLGTYRLERRLSRAERSARFERLKDESRQTIGLQPADPDGSFVIDGSDQILSVPPQNVLLVPYAEFTHTGSPDKIVLDITHH